MTGPVIDRRCFRLVLLETIHGMEWQVGQAVRNALHRELGKRPWVYFVLGQYDLAVLFESADLTTPTLARMGAIRGITSSLEIPCFRWIADGSSRTRKPLKMGATLALVFLKLRPQLLMRSGHALESALAGVLPGTRKMDVLGTCGWPECAVIISPPSAEFAALGQDIMWLNSLPVQLPGGTSQLLHHKSLSIFGVHLGEAPESFPAVCSRSRIGTDRAFPMVDVYCKPERAPEVRERANAMFATVVRSVAGRNDLHFEVTAGTWGAFLRSLVRFRRQSSDAIFDTTVTVTWPNTDHHAAPRREKHKQSPARAFTTVSQQAARRMVTTLEPYGHRVLRAIYDYNSLIQDELTRDSFADMRAFVPLLKSVANARSEDDALVLPDMLEAFLWGGGQRAYGAHVGIEEARRGLSSYRSGVQRLLQAIEYLPARLLRNMGMTWRGFVTVGKVEYFQHTSEILNIAYEDMADPVRWWGLFHEIGHVVNNTRPSFLSDESIMRTLRQLGVQPDAETFAELVSNVAADIFDLRYGFAQDWALYSHTVWRYLSECRRRSWNKPDIEKHALRTAFVALYRAMYLTGSKPGTNRLFSGQAGAVVDQVIGLVRDNLSLSSSECRRLSAYILRAYQQLFPLLPYLHVEFTGLDRALGERSPLIQANKEKAAQVVASLRSGQPWAGVIDNPELVVYSLLKLDAPLRFDVKIATVLSFWHSLVMEFPSMTSFHTVK
ncbi:hypothetical protein FJY68_09780 [candidate division WOR-3 bacterium]|uniref:Uncharacterized protein n=1 Tax=candidate division WOR-3 bacterium TaxID=2052148 RepID=A0A937XFB4_UNCW3|nr:hypothetical protein [candidate division WOR-3 bacterium]